MKRLSKNALLVLNYLYHHANRDFTIPEVYEELELLVGDENDVVKELYTLGLIKTERERRDSPLFKISEYGKHVYES